MARSYYEKFARKYGALDPTDPMITVKWPGGEMSVNQYWLERAPIQRLRKFIDMSVKVMSTEEERINGIKKKNHRR